MFYIHVSVFFFTMPDGFSLAFPPLATFLKWVLTIPLLPVKTSGFYGQNFNSNSGCLKFFSTPRKIWDDECQLYTHTAWNKVYFFQSPDNSHCNRIHTSLTADGFFKNINTEKQLRASLDEKIERNHRKVWIDALTAEIWLKFGWNDVK